MALLHDSAPSIEGITDEAESTGFPLDDNGLPPNAAKMTEAEIMAYLEAALAAELAAARRHGSPLLFHKAGSPERR